LVLVERSTTLELRQGPNSSVGGSSEEYWTMSESLIQQYFMSELKLYRV